MSVYHGYISVSRAVSIPMADSDVNVTQDIN